MKFWYRPKYKMTLNYNIVYIVERVVKNSKSHLDLESGLLKGRTPVAAPTTPKPQGRPTKGDARRGPHHRERAQARKVQRDISARSTLV